MTTPNRIKLAASACILLLLAACGADPGTNGTSTPGEPTTLVLASTQPAQLDHFPILYATETGMWEEAGLDVSFQLLSPAAGTAAVLSGSLDIFLDGTGLLKAAIESNRITILGSYSEVHLELWARPDSGLGQVTTVADLAQFEGRSIAGTTRGSLTDVVLRALLTQAGLRPDENVNFVYGLGGATSALAAQNGQVDVSVSTPSSVQSNVDQGLARLGDVNSLTDPPGRGLHTFIGVNTEYLDANRDVVRRFGEVYNAAAAAAQADPDVTAQLIAAHTGLSPDQALTALGEWGPGAGLVPLNDSEINFNLQVLSDTDGTNTDSAPDVFDQEVLFN